MANSDYTARNLVLPLCPTAIVGSSIAQLDTSIVISAFSSPTGEPIRLGSAAMLIDEDGSEEIIEIANQVGTTLTIARGCCDTIPQAHAAGAEIWFFDDYIASDSREYGATDTIGAKPLPKTTSGGPVPIEGSPPTEITFASRFARPYPPGQVEINGAPWFSGLTMSTAGASEMEITWAHRNRVTQADLLVDYTESSITPEVGTTYKLEFFRTIDDSVVRTLLGLTGVEYLYSIFNAQDDYGYDVSTVDGYAVLTAVRDGYESRMPYRIDFSFEPYILSDVSYFYTGAIAEILSGIDVRSDGMLIYKIMMPPATGTPSELIFAESDGVAYTINTSGDGWKVDPADGSEITALAFKPGAQFESSAGQVVAFLQGAGVFKRVSWVGDGSGARDITHGLGAAPAIAWVKSDESSTPWWTYSSEAGIDKVRPMPGVGTPSFATVANVFPAFSTSSVFKAGSVLNTLGVEYMALLFAETGSDVVSDTYIGNGSASGPSVTLPWEADILLIFACDSFATDVFAYVAAVLDDPDGPTHWFINLGQSPEYAALLTVDASGFDITSADSQVNSNGVTYHYWARKKL